MDRLTARWLKQIQDRGDGVGRCHVLVACSGGGDSTALLAFLAAIRRNLDLELSVAHADHGLRPESDQDAEFVRRLCRELDLDLQEAWLDVRRHAETCGQGIETAARELRWAWLQTEARACGASVVATGHTLDDHSETVLLRLARGGGTGSLTPLAARQGLRWSPLVEANREDLRSYLNTLGLPWREDLSNLEGFTARNRVRPLLAAIRVEAPALDRHLWETHAQVAELVALRDKTVASWRGDRWDLDSGPPPVIYLSPGLDSAEARWIMHAAFAELGWPMEASMIRDMAGWLVPKLSMRSQKPKTWGGWKLSASESVTGSHRAGSGWKALTRCRA